MRGLPKGGWTLHHPADFSVTHLLLIRFPYLTTAGRSSYLIIIT